MRQDLTAKVATKAASPKLSFHPEALRSLLVAAARDRRVMTYAEVGAAFGIQRWTQGATTQLSPVLARLGLENRKQNEPLLMALVVNKSSGLPGPGFFRLIGLPTTGDQKAAFAEHRDAAFAHNWV